MLLSPYYHHHRKHRFVIFMQNSCYIYAKQISNCIYDNYIQVQSQVILTKINKDYHFRVYLCDKDYLNKDEPIHKDIYRDITVHLQE